MNIKQKIEQLENKIRIDKLAFIYEQLEGYKGAQYLIRLNYNSLIQGQEIPGEYMNPGLIEQIREYEKLIENMFCELMDRGLHEEKINLLRNEINKTYTSKIAIKSRKMTKYYEQKPQTLKNKEYLRDMTSTMINYSNKLTKLEELIIKTIS